MKVGFVMIAHNALFRAQAVANSLTSQGCPVAIHLDSAAAGSMRMKSQNDLALHIPRTRTRWGSWELVAASLSGANLLLQRFPSLSHVVLLSGNCLPIKPIEELDSFLAARPDSDFIESAKASCTEWVEGGLQMERFTHRFPFDYRANPRAFALSTRIQRRFPARWLRQAPEGVDPHLGSQWWCLRAQTLRRILDAPNLKEVRRYFQGVWIPDESFFQTMAREHSDGVTGRSLTWAKFDSSGRPVVLYDNHLDALKNPENQVFFARKVWPGAQRLYDAFVGQQRQIPVLSDRRPQSGGLRSLIPKQPCLSDVKCPGIARRRDKPGRKPYRVLYGPDHLWPQLPRLIRNSKDQKWLGSIFTNGQQAPTRSPRTTGGLSWSVLVARANPSAYLQNLMRDCEGTAVFAVQTNAPVEAFATIAKDPMAHIVAVPGAWICSQFQSLIDSDAAFAAHQMAENRLLDAMKARSRNAKIEIVPLTSAIAHPLELADIMRVNKLPTPQLDLRSLATFIEGMRARGLSPTMEVPTPEDNDGYGRFVAAE